MTARSRSLLDLAHDMPCMFVELPHKCAGASVPCHADWQALGRGFAFKADDFMFAAGCNDAHDLIDGRKGGMPRESRFWAWLLAHVRTMRWIWERGLVRVT